MNEFLERFNDLSFKKAILIKMLRDRKRINHYKIFMKLFYVMLVINLILFFILFTNSTNKAIDNCVAGGLNRYTCEKEIR